MIKKVVVSCIILFATGTTAMASGLENSSGSKSISHKPLDQFVFDHPSRITFSTRPEKLFIQVDELTKEGKKSDPVTFNCHDFRFKINAGSGMVCENPDKSYIEDIEDYKNGSSGVATFS